jgi:trehalose-6-phosphate synthase
MDKSSCILSEFAGCARSLSGIFTINPYDVEDIATKIDEAINISSEEKL